MPDLTEHVRRRARAGTLPGCECILGVYRVRTSELLPGDRSGGQR